MGDKQGGVNSVLPFIHSSLQELHVVFLLLLLLLLLLFC